MHLCLFLASSFPSNENLAPFLTPQAYFQAIVHHFDTSLSFKQFNRVLTSKRLSPYKLSPSSSNDLPPKLPTLSICPCFL